MVIIIILGGYLLAGSASYCLLHWSDSRFIVGSNFNGGFKVPLVLNDNKNIYVIILITVRKIKFITITLEFYL